MATGRFDSNKVKFFQAFWFFVRFWAGLSVIILIILFALIFVSRKYYVSGDYPSDKRLGRSFDFLSDINEFNMNWDFGVIENYQRYGSHLLDYQKANQLIETCNQLRIPCFNHRLNLQDYPKFHHNPYYFVDDWWLHNCKNSYIPGWDLLLKQELARLPAGTVVVINEYYFNSLDKLFLFVKDLQKLNPHLQFMLGVQIHFQWFEPPTTFFKKLYVIHQIQKSGLRWMITEFSVYDRLYKPWRNYWIDDYIPLSLRRSLQNHQAFLFARLCAVSSQCFGFTIWSPSNSGAWFDWRVKGYTGRFSVFRDGQPTPLYWAVRRGLSSGKSF